MCGNTISLIDATHKPQDMSFHYSLCAFVPMLVILLLQNLCLCTDCGKYKYCLDKPKFGGHGTLKQCCAKRRCLGLTKSVGESQGKDVPYLAESLLFVLNTLSS